MILVGQHHEKVQIDSGEIAEIVQQPDREAERAYR